MNGLLIGRFQPFHLGHIDAIKQALSNVDNLWIGIGSSNKSNEIRNPFTATERKEMIISSLDDSLLTKIKIFFIPDMENHEEWTFKIDSIIPKYDVVFSNDDFTKSLFSKRGIEIISPSLKQRSDLSGTNIRTKIKNGEDWKLLVPVGTTQIIEKVNGIFRIKDM